MLYYFDFRTWFTLSRLASREPNPRQRRGLMNLLLLIVPLRALAHAVFFFLDGILLVSVVGDDAMDSPSVVPKPVAFGLIGLIAVLLGWMVYPAVSVYYGSGSLSLAVALWQSRVLDVWIQIALIFSGVMGVLGLLSEKAPGRAEEIQS